MSKLTLLNLIQEETQKALFRECLNVAVEVEAAKKADKDNKTHIELEPPCTAADTKEPNPRDKIEEMIKEEISNVFKHFTLSLMEDQIPNEIEDPSTRYATLAAAFHDETGMNAPGVPAEKGSSNQTTDDVTQAQKWAEWLKNRQNTNKQVGIPTNEMKQAPGSHELKTLTTLKEKEMTKSEKDKQEKYVKGMKKNTAEFKDKYGSRAKDVMYATASKMAQGKK